MSIRVFNKPAVVIGGGSSATLSSISISSNGTYSASLFGVDGFDVVDVDVQASGGGGETDLVTGFAYCVVPSYIGRTKTLANGAFALDSVKKNIDFNNVMYVPQHCCFSDTNLSFVKGSKVEIIGHSAFQYCSNLKTFDFPNVKFINYGAFADCSNITSLPDMPNLFAIGGSAFASAAKLLTFSVSAPTFQSLGSNAINMTSCTTVSLPYFMNAVLGSSPVFGFSHSRLTNVYAPEMMVLGSYMFSGASLLSSLTLSSVIVAIEQGAFDNCRKLEDIDITFAYAVNPNNVFRSCYSLKSMFAPFFGQIGSNAFLSCSRISTIFLAVSYIGNSCFFGCSNLESLYLLTCSTTGLANASVFNGTPMSNSALLGHYGSIYVPSSWVASFKAATNWLAYSDRITAIPSEIESMFAFAYEFMSSNITSIPSEKRNVQYVLHNAFSNCTSLESVDLPNCLAVGRMGFYNCKSISTISMPSCLTLHNMCFSSLSTNKLKNIYLPNCIFIGSYVFNSISTISSLTLNNLVYLSDYNFQNCSGFDNFNAPNLKTMAQNCFYRCGVKTISLPEILHLHGNDFTQCNSLEYVDLPKVIVCRGFDNCGKVSYFSAPNLISCYLTGMGLSANIFNCPKLLEIDNYFLQQVSYLTKFSFNNIRRANSGISFLPMAYSLTKVNLSLVKYLYSGCFDSCYSLSKVLAPNLLSLGSNCFRYCYRLESIYLFNDTMCDLTDGTCFGATPLYSQYISYISNRYTSIFVPSILLSQYQTAPYWSDYSERFVGLTNEEMQDIIDHFDD